MVATSVFDYDQVGRLTDLTHNNAASLAIADYTWTFDVANRIETMDLVHQDAAFNFNGGEKVTATKFDEER